MRIEIEATKDGLSVKTPYSAQFVSELKRLVPESERRFDGTSKAWIVDPRHGAVVQKLILSIFRCAVGLPAIKAGAGKLERETVRLEYLGQCKVRNDGSVSAFGHDGKDWSLIAPESVLRDFFSGDVEIEVDGVKDSPTVKPATLYGVLLVSQVASFDEIKSAYRRMARLTHPDVNHEPDAHEQFRAVKRAWDVLGSSALRKKYDAGLALQASMIRERGPRRASIEASYFRTPLRCGLLTIDGERRLGRIVLSKIHAWEDITDAQGRVMVTSWNSNRETYEVNWA